MTKDFIQIIFDKLLALINGVGESLITSMMLLIALMLVEIVWLGWSRSSLFHLVKGRGTAILDAISALLVLSNLSLIIGTVFSLGIFYMLGTFIKVGFDFHLLDYISNPIISYGIYILALDFSNYWAHRWMHRSTSLWQIHRFHHSATEMTMLTVLRDHPLERVLLHCINAIPAAILGLPFFQIFSAMLLMQAIGFLKHSNFRSGWGFLGRWIIQSPAAHRLHHSIDAADHDCNFASIFQFWDVLFGTAKVSEYNRSIIIGVDGESNPLNPISAIWNTTKAFYAAILPHR